MPTLELCLTLLILVTSPLAQAQAIQDSRCYLMNGGAVESFFISEDTPVGSVIGTLSINGETNDEEGDITLRLQEKGAAVGIAPGTKNLTLLRALDREEKLGPSNVYVNVRCDRRRTTDPVSSRTQSFIIPVSVRVWDVNDNAPLWQVPEQHVRLSELTAVGTRVAASLRATDADQPGPHATLHYSVLPGPYSDYLEFPNELDSVLVLHKPLDYETVRNFTVVVRAQDQGSPPLHSDIAVHVMVLDADDQNPAFSHDHYSAVLPEDAVEGTILKTSPGPIFAADQDLGINAPLQYNTTGDNKQLVKIDRDTGKVAVTKELLEVLHQPITIVIKASQVDNPDRYALSTLSVSSRVGSGRGVAEGMPRVVRFSREQYNTAVSEAAPVGTVLTTLTTKHEHQLRNPLQFYVSDRSFLDKFAINSAGEVILRKPLDYETTDSYQYQVMVTDSITNDTASINITVLNANEWEPRFRFPQYEFLVEQPLSGAVDEEGHGLVPVGKLEVYDGDKSDTVTLTLRGSDASMLYMNNSGEMYLRERALGSLNTSVLHVVATAVDSGSPPRQTSVPVIVHVGERLLQSAGAGNAGAVAGGVSVLVAVFGAAVCALLLLVCALLLHMYRARSRTKPPTSENKASGFVNQEKPRSPATSTPPAHTATPAPEPAATSASGPATAGCSGSLLSVSAGASTILANSNSSLDLRAETLPPNGLHTNSTSVGQSQRFSRSKVAPLSTGASGAGATSLMSDHLQQTGGAGRSGVAWPCGTIPAKVKTLSWDEPADRTTGMQGSREGSPVHDATNPALTEHMNLTVYF